jgi:mannose-6-phosphate isomerase-like protein (cupin superfamily)
MHCINDDNRHVDTLTNRFLDPLPFKVDGPEDLAALRHEWAKRESIPCVIPDRDAALDHSWPGIDVRTFLGGDNSSGRLSYHDIELQAGAGLARHFHESSHTYIYVLEGMVELTIGAVSEPSAAGTFGYAPPCTTQGVVNTGAVPARLYVAYVPAGADRAFAEAHQLWKTTGAMSQGPYLAILRKYGFHFDASQPLANDARTNAPVSRREANIESFEDFSALRETWKSRPATPKLVHGVEGLRFARLPDPPRDSHITSSVLVSGDEDSGRAAWFHCAMLPRYMAPPHHQSSEEEVFFVVEGEIDLICGTQFVRAGPGAFGFAPRNATHGFSNALTTSTTRILTMNSPAGHERGAEMVARELSAPSERLPELLVAHGWSVHQMEQVV